MRGKVIFGIIFLRREFVFFIWFIMGSFFYLKGIVLSFVFFLFFFRVCNDFFSFLNEEFIMCNLVLEMGGEFLCF